MATRPPLTFDELADVIRRSAGVHIDSAELSTRAMVKFIDLEIDSLGMLGVVNVLEKSGVLLHADAHELTTPAELLAHFNAQLTELDAPAHTESSILIDAPFDLVWTVTNDVPSWPQLFSEYAAAEVLERDGDSVTFRLTMYPDENGKVWSWVSQRTMDRAAGRVEAHRVETGPFEFMHIRWTYEQQPNGVLLRWVQDFRMKPTAPIDTPAMAERINTNSAVQLELIRSKVEQLAKDVVPAD
jgi:aromatase